MLLAGLDQDRLEEGPGEGNFPQAFSHLGLINYALQLARADHREATT